MKVGSRDAFATPPNRCIINGVFWCMGLEKDIKPDMDIAFIGPYHPVRVSFNGERKGVKPAIIPSIF